MTTHLPAARDNPNRTRSTPMQSSIAIAGLALAAGLVLASETMAQTPDHSAVRPMPAPVPRTVGLPRSSVGEMMQRRLRDRPEAAGKPVIGVVLAPDAKAGVRIAAVTPSGAAAAAGLRTGDRLLSIDGHAVLGSSGALRLANVRKLLDDLDTRTAVRVGYERGDRRRNVSLTPKPSDDVIVWVDRDGQRIRTQGDVLVLDRADLGAFRARVAQAAAPGVAPRIQREVNRLGRGGDCQGAGCATPALLEAFRWQGLNLATVDPQLGRYFGTSSGVLVLSTGAGLAALRPGDVIRRIDGKPVATPREAMDALRAGPAGSQVALELLRDRKATTVRMRTPQAMSHLPLPPPAPAPPAPPKPSRTPAPPSALLDPAVIDGATTMVVFAPPPPSLATPPMPPAMPVLY